MCLVKTIGSEQAWQEQSCEAELIAKAQALPNHSLAYPGQHKIHSQFSQLGSLENLNVIKQHSELLDGGSLTHLADSFTVLLYYVSTFIRPRYI